MRWFADFETLTPNTKYYQEHQDTKVLVAGLMNENNTIYKVFSNIDDFMVYIINNLKSDDVLFFHNLTWDGNFIYKWCFRNNWKPVNTIEELEHKNIYMFRDKAKIFEIVLKWKNKQITIKCSYLLLCSSIDDIAKDLGQPDKATFIDNNPQFYDVEPKTNWWEYDKQFLDYLKNDINVARHAVLNYSNAIREKYAEFCIMRDINKFLTTGALSYELQKYAANNYGLDAQKIMYCTVDEYEFYKNWFFGGLTQFNPTIQQQLIEPDDGKIIDINSAYPFAMTKPLPVDKLYDLDEHEPREGQDVYYYYHLRIKSAKAKYLQTPFLRNWKAKGLNENRYVYTLENFECYYLKQELDTLTKYYDFEGVEILGTYWCEVKPFLSDYINTIYDLKTYYKKQKNKSSQLLYKILLNAGYGKYAQRYNLKREFWVPAEKKQELLDKGGAKLKLKVKSYHGTEIIENEYYTFALSKLTAVDNVAGMANIAVLKREINRAHNILVAGTITALNRVFLMESIYAINPVNFYYCDTDAIFFNAKNVDLNNIEIDAYKLGAWDYEQNMKTLVVLGAKAYWAVGKQGEKKVKFSGVNKKFLERFGVIDWFLGDNEDNTLKGATLKRKETPSGLVLVIDDYEIKERKH